MNEAEIKWKKSLYDSFFEMTPEDQVNSRAVRRCMEIMETANAPTEAEADDLLAICQEAVAMGIFDSAEAAVFVSSVLILMLAEEGKVSIDWNKDGSPGRIKLVG